MKPTTSVKEREPRLAPRPGAGIDAEDLGLLAKDLDLARPFELFGDRHGVRVVSFTSIYRLRMRSRSEPVW